MPSRPLPKSACEALKQVHPDVCKRYSFIEIMSYNLTCLSCVSSEWNGVICRYFGCGLVIPEKLEGCAVLDLGSGSGRDCYVLSKLVGERGQVIGLDMTDEMVLHTFIWNYFMKVKQLYFWFFFELSCIIIWISVKEVQPLTIVFAPKWDSCLAKICPVPSGEVWILKTKHYVCERIHGEAHGCRDTEKLFGCSCVCTPLGHFLHFPWAKV